MNIRPKSQKYTTAVLSGPIASILGVSWDTLVAEVKLQTPDHTGSGSMVDATDYSRLWNALIHRSGRSETTRFLGQRMSNGLTIPVLFALSTAPDLATGLERLARYEHLFGPMRLLVRETAARFSVRVSPDELSVPLPPTLAATQIVFLHERAQSLAVRPFSPVAVSMPLPRAERETLMDIFGQVPTEGDATLHYRREDAGIPFISGDNDLWQATEADLIAAARIAKGQTSVTERVTSCFLEAFSICEPRIAYVCDSLHVSRTTLIRRLRAEGTSFQQLLEHTRRTLAVRYLTKSELSNQQIAHLVGYNDPNAFQRAFKRWTGTTPQSLRQAQRDLG